MSSKRSNKLLTHVKTCLLCLSFLVLPFLAYYATHVKINARREREHKRIIELKETGKERQRLKTKKQEEEEEEIRFMIRELYNNMLKEQKK